MLNCYAVEIARNGIREKVPSTKDQKVRRDLGGRVGGHPGPEIRTLMAQGHKGQTYCQGTECGQGWRSGGHGGQRKRLAKSHHLKGN